MAKIAPRFDDLPVLGPHGFTRVGYTEWGERNARRTIVCVHGLTRNSRDFDWSPFACATPPPWRR